MMMYPALFIQDGKYIRVEFPDVPDAMTSGVDFNEAYEMAQEVLGLVLEDYQEYPKPSQLSEVQSDGAAIVLIPIDMVAYMKKYHGKTIKNTVSVPEYLDMLAREEGINKSEVYTEALENKLAYRLA
jgi:predicted RNase H-like HicB family nuclease